MSKLRLAPKPIEPSTSFKSALRARAALIEATNRDRGYQALRLRGLAGLLRGTGEHFQELTNMDEVMFYLASALDEIAEGLSPDVGRS